MKLVKYLLLAGTALIASEARSSVTIQLDSGVLSTSTGAPLTSGLLQLIAVRSSTPTFVAPSPTSFIGGDIANELVVSSFAFSQGGSGFVTGESDNVINYSYESTTAQNSTTTFDPGDALLLRWYPTLTLASTAPGVGTMYGQYRSSTAPDGGLTFFGPPDARTFVLPNGLNFLTTTAGGSNSDLAGRASNVVVGVPEPSSMMILGSAVAGLLGWAKMRRRA